MKGSPDAMVAVAQRLGVREIPTSARNWAALHNAVIITLATAPGPLPGIVQQVHAVMDASFAQATPNPMDDVEPDQVCVVRMHGSTLLPVLACIDKVLRLDREGVLLLIGEPGDSEMLIEAFKGARASFYEYLRSLDVGAEILFEEV